MNAWKYVPLVDLDPGASSTSSSIAADPTKDAVGSLTHGLSRFTEAGQTVFYQGAAALVLVVVAGIAARRGRNLVAGISGLLGVGLAVLVAANPTWYVDLFRGLAALFTGK